MNSEDFGASSSHQTAPRIEESLHSKRSDVLSGIKVESQTSSPSSSSLAAEIKIEETENANLLGFPDLQLEEDTNLPSTGTEINRFKFHDVQGSKKPMGLVATITVRLVRVERKLEEEFPKAEEALSKLLSCLRVLAKSESFSAKDEKDVEIRYILTTLMGENPKVKGPYAYPPGIQMQANELLQYVNERLPTIEVASEDVDEAEAGSSTSGAHPRPHKRRRTNTQEQQRPLALSQKTMNEVMRNIFISTEGRRSYSIKDNSVARSSKVVGDNGILVGTWWPLRICALRDGAHGALMAGISGSIDDGAYSIVVASQYADLDKDFGDRIEYSGSKSLENTDPVNPIMTSSTRSLQTSKRERRSVRVIRAAGGNPDYSPFYGFRYDGLYRITEESLPRNKKGGCYIRFTLHRNSGQPEIDRSRPNKEERAIFSRLKEF